MYFNEFKIFEWVQCLNDYEYPVENWEKSLSLKEIKETYSYLGGAYWSAPTSSGMKNKS